MVWSKCSHNREAINIDRRGPNWTFSSDPEFIPLSYKAKIGLDVFGTLYWNNDFAVKPTDIINFFPTIERGIVYYRHTTDQNELINLRDYLCPDFITRQAVVITYFCLGENVSSIGFVDEEVLKRKI